jgi:uncharacterized protein (TIGR02271 family)
MKWGIREGMVVKGADGERLGTVVRCTDEGFVVERGLFFPKALLARYEDVTGIRDDELQLARRRPELSECELSDAPGREIRIRNEGERRDAFAPDTEPRTVRVPLAEEIARPQVVAKQVGQVRIRKRVVTEMKTFTLPVRREELEIERLGGRDEVVPATARAEGGGPAREGPTFEEQTLVIPLYEEVIEFEVKPVLYEEVRITKHVSRKDEEARTTVRREVANVERQGEVPQDADKTHVH